jgi:hypothetical protein
MPFYEKRGMTSRGFGQLVWYYLILNRKPHTKWHEVPAVGAPATAE